MDRIVLKINLQIESKHKVQEYHDMLQDFIIPQFQQREGFQDITFYKGCLTSYIDCCVKQFLIQHFKDVGMTNRNF